MEDLTPRKIVAYLDKYIIGQDKAKRAVAIALRNRYRRSRLSEELREEVVPKNILLIGPTGVGKTEIARRLARMVNAPFVKVEATKFTEVGYVGRDVEAIIRELVETSVRMVRQERMAAVEKEAEKHATERLLNLLSPLPRQASAVSNPFGALLGIAGKVQPDAEGSRDEEYEEKLAQARQRREILSQRLQRGELEEELVEIEVEDNSLPFVELFSGTGEEIGVNFHELLGGMLPKRKKKRRVSVKVARRLLIQEEAAKMIDMDEVTAEAIRRTEEMGIVFLDEIDKIAGKEIGSGPDVSREGVQRDILPIVEGCTVVTKYGPVKTDHILFIAAGAFHVSKPSDLIPELQGRFPLRVELDSLTRDDFKQILTKPENALLKQYQALLETEGIKLHFTADAIDEIAAVATQINEQTENIGARRLHTIMERLLEEISFFAPELGQDTLEINAAYVKQQLGAVVKDQDLSRYIL
ncbi:MAG TPA: ATP-dependent protease ATPase subunit HslU [Firmicutes bacterium]|nr:ATP-dependent protease ATPase subunit HslU [Bacillota bacterium]